eukprot:s1738_g7.t1
MSAEEVGTCYSDLQKFKKSSAPDTVLECWKGSAADPAPRLQEIAAQFVVAPDLAAVETARAQLRNELLQSNRDVVALGDEEEGIDQADQDEECDDQEGDEGEAADQDEKKRPRGNGAGPLWSAMQQFIKTDSL